MRCSAGLTGPRTTLGLEFSRASTFIFAVCLLVAACRPVPVSAQAAPPQNADQQDEPTIRVDVDLVNVLFSVRDKKGQIIANLEKSNFKLFEDGKEQKIERFSRETDLPLTLGLLVDISASQQNLIGIEQQAASSFFTNVIRPKDEAFLISFGKSTDLLQDYTSSPKTLKAALSDLRGDMSTPMMGGGPVNSGPVPQLGRPKGTLMFDAIYLAANEKLKQEVGRKAIVLVTDGEDQGSYYKRADAIEAAHRSDSIIYSIYYVDPMFYGMYGVGSGAGESELKKMSTETGGHVFTVDRKHSLMDIFQDLQDEMRSQYAISYRSTNPKRDGSFRKIEIRTDNGNYRVQARRGYYATANDGQ